MVTKLKISELKNDEPLKEALRLSRKKIGSTHDVDKDDLQILIDYLKKHCGFIYPEEIPHAFDMAIEGRFEYIDPNSLANMKTRFTQAFLSSIMKPYLKHRSQQQQRPNSDFGKILKPIPKDEYLQRFLFDPYKKYLQTGEYPFNQMDELCLYNTVRGYLGVIIPITDNHRKLAQSEGKKSIFGAEIDDAAAKRIAFRYWVKAKAENLENIELLNE